VTCAFPPNVTDQSKACQRGDNFHAQARGSAANLTIRGELATGQVEFTNGKRPCNAITGQFLVKECRTASSVVNTLAKQAST
jgi:hypothetical protein